MSASSPNRAAIDNAGGAHCLRSESIGVVDPPGFQPRFSNPVPPAKVVALIRPGYSRAPRASCTSSAATPVAGLATSPAQRSVNAAPCRQTHALRCVAARAFPPHNRFFSPVPAGDSTREHVQVSLPRLGDQGPIRWAFLAGGHPQEVHVDEVLLRQTTAVGDPLPNPTPLHPLFSLWPVCSGQCGERAPVDRQFRARWLGKKPFGCPPEVPWCGNCESQKSGLRRRKSRGAPPAGQQPLLLTSPQQQRLPPPPPPSADGPPRILERFQQGDERLRRDAARPAGVRVSARVA